MFKIKIMALKRGGRLQEHCAFIFIPCKYGDLGVSRLLSMQEQMLQESQIKNK